ncbi:MAG: MaoC family dehydratase [Deltaproteobacteria bacterium]|nr:MaoC family dehydratase [Nannocystaceae bacterium]
MSDRLRVHGIEGLRGIIGRPLGPSVAVRIDQEAVQRFADATGDHQWIHLDVARARTTAFGGTIVHGYFVLSLVPSLLFGELLDVQDVGSILNYGADKLRFPDVARVGSEITLSAELTSLTPRPPGEMATFNLTFAASGSAKPCCVAQILLLFLP